MTDLIASLKSCLAEVQHLKELSYTNREWQLWRDKVLDLLAMHTGHDSEERGRFRGLSSYTISYNPETRQKYYFDDIESYETQLMSIIQRLEMRINHEKPTESVLGATPVPLSAMHPKIREVAGPLFGDGHRALAILEAFKAVNNEVKRVSDLVQDGQQLMATAFDEKNPVLRLNELQTQSEKDEQAGFKFLYMGAMSGIRNPKAHEQVPNPDEVRTLEYLSLASLLMRRIDDANNHVR